MKITSIILSKPVANKISKKKSENRTLFFKNHSSNSIYDFSAQQFPKPKINSIYENYDAAQKIFRKNIEDGKGIFGSTDNLEELMQNDIIRRNVVVFFAEYSKEKMDEITSKKIIPINEAKEYEALKEVNDFFAEFEQLWPDSELNKYSNTKPQKELAFAGNVTKQQEKHCNNVVHVFSAGCAALSAAMGEGAAVGADTPILRTAQFIMFAYLSDYLNVPAVPSVEYYIKEMLAGATLGVDGAKLIISWLGIGGHAVSTVTGTSLTTAGGADAAISGSVRAVNGILSGIITEKMGRGYIKRVDKNRMNFRDQTIETGMYFANAMVLSGEKNLFNLFKDINFNDASDPDAIKTALETITPAQAKATSTILDVVAKNTIRTGETFLIDSIFTLIATREKDPQKRKQIAKEVFKQCLIRSIVYELCGDAIKGGITKEAAKTIEEINKNLDKYPEVYHTFIEKEAEFIKRINIEDLSSNAFVNQFKNKLFVVNLSRFCNDAVREMEIKWVNRNSAKNKEELTRAINQKKQEEERAEQIDNSLTLEEKAECKRVIKELQDILDRQKQIMTMHDNFGYGRIAGYENAKEILTQKFITPLSLQKTPLQSKIPNAFLLYGPTGTGKSELVKAVAEQGKCRLVQFSDADSIDELKAFLNKQIQQSKNSDRHFVIQIDEFDEFGSDEELADIFSKFIDKCFENNITLFLTTNEPLDIDDEILNKTINIPIAPADKKDCPELLKYYIPNLSQKDYNEITEAILKKAGNKAYSNGQIQNMSAFACANTKDKSLKDTMLKIIQVTPPEISEDDIQKFNDEQKTINEI